MTEQDSAPEPLSREQIRPTKRAHEDGLIARPGVVGVDIGEKWSDGQPTGRQAIVVHVTRKLDAGDLSDDQRIPATIDGVPTDVVEHRVVLHHEATHPGIPTAEDVTALMRGRVRPLAGGVSIGPVDPVTIQGESSAELRSVNGTLGVVVTERHTGRALALTNWHVAAGDGLEDVGSQWVQPARADGARPGDQIGQLVRGTLTDRIDAAVVALAPGARWVPGIVGIGAVTGSAKAVAGSVVRKHGRTTGLRTGRVVSTDFTTSVDFGPGIGWRTLRDQLRVEPEPGQTSFSAGGDSGSAVVDEDGKVVGLLWAGEHDGSYSVANPIDAVLGTLGVDVATPASVRARRAALARQAAQAQASRLQGSGGGLFPPVAAAYRGRRRRRPAGPA
ncbi:trypsin-like peptidase domain-containing protein, partial [Cellulomonas biazotea]